jgi:hypothetical protein
MDEKDLEDKICKEIFEFAEVADGDDFSDGYLCALQEVLYFIRHKAWPDEDIYTNEQ